MTSSFQENQKIEGGKNQMKNKIFYASEIVKRTVCYDFMSLISKTKRELRSIYKRLMKVIWR